MQLLFVGQSKEQHLEDGLECSVYWYQVDGLAYLVCLAFQAC
jgi:hypothetical protein